MQVPFFDFNTERGLIAADIEAELRRVIETGNFILGEEVSQFENAFATFCHAEHCVGVGSGTEALHLALRACDVTAGDEVITAANTFIATALAISYTGARPVLVDVDRDTYTIDPARIDDAITGRTRAIIPVHLYGHPADMDPILAIAHTHGLRVIEDACQAHGAVYKGRRCGALGDVGCFSFYPTKNLGAYGDAGALVTNDCSLSARLRLLRNHGQSVKYHHEVMGYNSRLDALQAALLNVKLRYLDEWNTRRHTHAASYNERLGHVAVALPTEADWAGHVYHLYVIAVKRRVALQRYLAQHQVSTLIHYPIPIRKLPPSVDTRR